MLRVEISAPSPGAWVDHAGTPIDMLVFSKAWQKDYIPGHYPLHSFGELYRNIDDIPESPVQSISEWSISIGSSYSSPGGEFSTLDLLYSLEAINEECGKEFNIIGCAASLIENESGTDKTLFRGAVDKASNSGGTTSISISELLQNPSIERSEAPILLGESKSSQYIPVAVTRNDLGVEEILLGNNVLAEAQLYIYLEKAAEYAAVEFVGEDGKPNAFLSADKRKFTFMEEGQPPVKLIPQDLQPADALWLRTADVADMRTDSQSSEPANFIMGRAGGEETVQAWTTRKGYAGDGNGGETRLGRDASESNRRSHEKGAPIKRTSQPRFLALTLAESPISIAETADAVPRTDGDFGHVDFSRYPTYGNPTLTTYKNVYPELGWVRGESGSFLGLSRKWVNEGRPAQGGTPEGSPTVSLEGWHSKDRAAFYRFTMRLPDKGLPEDAVATSFDVNIYSERPSGYAWEEAWLGLDSFQYVRLLLGKWDYTHAYDMLHSQELPLRKTQAFHLNIILDNNEGNGNSKDYFSLHAAKATRRIRIPWSESIKLYAKLKPASLQQGGSNGRHVKPAAESLLAAAGRKDIWVVDSGQPSSIEYGTALIGESAKFRDKLRSLAAASATLFRSATTDFGNVFILKSLVDDEAAADKTIPGSAILLRNNIASFQMQTPERMDACTGVEITWGKNLRTGSYENRTLVSGGSIQHNGTAVSLSGYALSRWRGIFGQLRKNEQSHGGPNIKTAENEWVRDQSGAEHMAYFYLYWLCKPLRKASLACITPLLPAGIDLGTLIYLDLPGYPARLKKTAWMVTEIKNDLDSHVTELQLLEAWSVPVIAEKKYLLAEDSRIIMTEAGERLKLED
ncbi:hypothetical protein R83H12_00439 [Fibrobacteria bacterium R8-3-H12]